MPEPFLGDSINTFAWHTHGKIEVLLETVLLLDSCKGVIRRTIEARIVHQSHKISRCNLR
jgi:hypothetical protein